ncbi:gamma carbonic anhydrase family protein [Flexibacterium corallicola]|uniref:gamma carbonic anhydrase family protein n=1 Tax=Flexibacterium corallicola TaxID=3037259 RepID=UPI00286EFAAE|nr:gamma carbonic anhydrase family protein [Pseudovibrio sp. M1P-2-3]
MQCYQLGDKKPTFPENGQYWVAPTATLIGDVILGEEASVWFGAILRGDREALQIGSRTNIQDGCVLHTDMGFPLEIDEGVTVGHNAILHGCKIGKGSLIGMGATILNGAKVGRHCIIGANSLIPEGKEIPDFSLVVGIPGKVIRSLPEDIKETLEGSAQGYVDNWRRYKDGLSEL